MTSPSKINHKFFKFIEQGCKGRIWQSYPYTYNSKGSPMKLFESKEYHFLDDKNINKKNNKFNF